MEMNREEKKEELAAEKAADKRAEKKAHTAQPEAAHAAVSPPVPPQPTPVKPPAHAAPPAPTEVPLSSLDGDALKALCGSLNDQIIALHGEGKHEEGDALRAKHLNALEALKYKSNPLGYA